MIPRSLSSGALSIISNATASPVPNLTFNVFVIAAVKKYEQVPKSVQEKVLAAKAK